MSWVIFIILQTSEPWRTDVEVKDISFFCIAHITVHIKLRAFNTCISVHTITKSGEWRLFMYSLTQLGLWPRGKSSFSRKQVQWPIIFVSFSESSEMPTFYAVNIKEILYFVEGETSTELWTSPLPMKINLWPWDHCTFSLEQDESQLCLRPETYSKLVLEVDAVLLFII